MNTFSFDGQKVSSMSLEDFLQSGRIVDASSADDSSTWDTPHQFLTLIQTMLKEWNCPFHFDLVYVSSKGAEYLADPLDRDKPKDELRRWAFKTLVTRVLLYEKSDVIPAPDYAPAIGIGFTEQGVAITIGTDVWVCRNMSIFGNKYIQSYGADALGFNDFRYELDSWIRDAEQIHRHNVKILNNLQGQMIDSVGGIQKLIGQLYLAREGRNTGIRMPAPLDKDELSEFAKRIFNDYPDLITINRQISLYDLYNVCTNILTHSEKNLHNKWLDLVEMGEFISEHYPILHEEPQQDIATDITPESEGPRDVTQNDVNNLQFD